MSSDIHLDLVDRVRIASPCPMRWEDLDGGGETVRHCRHCDLDVYNLPAMTRAEVEALLAGHQGGRLCGRIYRRADGTMLLKDCPVGVRALRRRAVRLVARAAAAVGLLLVGGVALERAQGGDRPGLSRFQPFATVRRIVRPPQPIVMGVMIAPPPARPATGTGPGPAGPARPPCAAELGEIAADDREG